MSYEKISVLQSIINVQGKILYNDGRRRINLKKPIRDIFEPLETETQEVGYVIELCLSKDRMLMRTKELMEQQVIPMLFYFVKKPIKNQR